MLSRGTHHGIFVVQDWDQQNAAQIVTELCGFVTILSGTFLLHATKDMGDSTGLSSYTPLTFSLLGYWGVSWITRICADCLCEPFIYLLMENVADIGACILYWICAQLEPQSCHSKSVSLCGMFLMQVYIGEQIQIRPIACPWEGEIWSVQRMSTLRKFLSDAKIHFGHLDFNHQLFSWRARSSNRH